MESQLEDAHPHELVPRHRADAVGYIRVEVALPRDSSKLPFVRPERLKTIRAEVVPPSCGLNLSRWTLCQQLRIAQSPADTLSSAFSQQASARSRHLSISGSPIAQALLRVDDLLNDDTHRIH